MKLILLTAGLLLAAVVMLGVKVLFVRGGRFPSGHASSIPALHRRGIGCAHADEPEMRSGGSRKGR
ncbi:MAG: hypothetical protein NC336_04000 [Clostridium sp.]|nr:hypothetical protein [Clostridium sp.]